MFSYTVCVLINEFLLNLFSLNPRGLIQQTSILYHVYRYALLMCFLRFIILISAVCLTINLPAQLNSEKPYYNNRTIIAKGDKQFAPFEFINEKGEPDGFSVELFRALMKRLDIKYELSLEDWGKVQNELQNKKIDLAIGMIYSKERAENVKFGIPHCMISYNIICRKDNDFTNLEALRGKEIIVQNQDRAHVYLQETKLTDKIILVENIAQAIELLSSGKHEAVLSFDVSSFYFIKKGNYKNLIIHHTDIEPEKYSIVVNTDNEDILYLLNAAIYQMKIDGEYDKIYYKWFGIYEKPKISKVVWYVLIILGTFLVIFAVFIRLLKKKVKQSTKSLKIKNEETLKLVENLKHENEMRLVTEKKLVEAKEHAEESDRLKSAFLANVSHEIRTPLNAIVGFSTIICETEDLEERNQYKEIIRQNNELLLQLINDILDLSKIESGVLITNQSHFTVGEVCNHVISSANLSLHSGNARLIKEINFDCTLNSDRSRIIQVLTNFINNALKFTYQGSITLRAEAAGANNVEISVIDTGIGIDKDQLQQVFKRFTKLNSFIQGTGLGLSISKSIIERLGGEIGVESEIGTGSRFWIRMPVATDTPTTLYISNLQIVN